MALDELVFLRPELGITLLHFQKLLGVEVAKEGHAHHSKAVRPHIRDLFGDIDVHPVDEGGDGDQGCCSQNDAEKRQKTP